jgi:predicted  nucleic acid-binding Zn-ribbon protein
MQNSPKQVMDIRVQKGFNAREGNEHQRNWDDKKWSHAAGYGTYDRTRDALNFEIVKGKVQSIDRKKSIPERIRESLSSRHIKDPNEGLAEPKYRTVVNFIFGGSRERMHEIAFGNQKVDLNKDADNSQITRSKEIERWASDVYNFVAEKYGEENIASFVVHLDETNPHAHCTLLPIWDGKFAYKKMFAGANLYDYKDKMRKLHDDFAAVTEKWGFTRGSDVAKTGARNIPPHEYRRLLSIECDSLEEQIKYNKSLLVQLKNEVSHAERRVKGLTTMIGNLEQKRTEMEDEMTQLAEQIKAGQGDSVELQKRIDRLSGEYQKTLDSLNDKRQKLGEATRKLDELRTLSEESKEKAEDYRAQADEYKKSVQESSMDMTRQVQYRIADAALSQAIFELKELIPPSILERESPDGSFLQDLAEHGEAFLKCAAMLFVGYVDGATTIAKNSGGGGASSSTPWGRDDDEDDRRWARRCLAQASKMMRPSSGKSVKRK